MQGYILERAQRQSKLAAERALIESHKKKSVNYFGTIGKVNGVEAGKFGESDDFHTRITTLKRELGDIFVLECVVECEKNALLEQRFKKHPEIICRRFKAVINGKMQTELIRLDDEFGPNDVNKIYNDLKEQIYKEIDKEMRHKERMLELHIQQSELKVRQTELDVQQSDRHIGLKKLDVELKKLDIQSQQIQLQSQSPQPRPSQLARPSRARTTQSSERVRPKSGPIKVSQYSLDGQLIKTHNSFVEAAKAVHGNRTTLSDKCASGQAYLEYIWKLAE
jgi:hypothetical protein